MLGWHVSVYRQADGGATPAARESVEGARVAVWQTGVDGLDWLKALIHDGQVIDLGGNGYPSRFTATAAVLLPMVGDMPPQARTDWLREAGDMVTEKWEGKTAVNAGAGAQCRPDEWLLVEVWDES